MPAIIGAVGNPYYENLRRQMEMIGEYGPTAREYMRRLEEAYGPSASVLPMITSGATQAMAGGLSPEERLAGERRVGQRYRTAVAGQAGAGAQMGRFNPRAVQRLAVREAGRTLVPGMAELEAQHGRRRMEGLRTGLGALGGVYPHQARAEEMGRQSFGQLMGQVLGGAAGGTGIRRPKRIQGPAVGTPYVSMYRGGQ